MVGKWQKLVSVFVLKDGRAAETDYMNLHNTTPNSEVAVIAVLRGTGYLHECRVKKKPLFKIFLCILL